MGRFFIHVFMKNFSWLFLISSFSFAGYHHFVKAKDAAICSLKSDLELLQKKKDLAYLLKEELEMKIASKNDPRWIEMILMKKLGLVPEGYMKVHFIPESYPSSALEGG